MKDLSDDIFFPRSNEADREINLRYSGTIRSFVYFDKMNIPFLSHSVARTLTLLLDSVLDYLDDKESEIS